MIITEYHEGFETGELRGWASYPPCQDTAYDPFTYPGKIHPDDSSTCLVAEKNLPWHEDQLLGAVKLFDLTLDNACRIYFRYFIKTVDHCSNIEVHLPLSTGERLIHRVTDPIANQWNQLTITWHDIVALSGFLQTAKQVRITAMAIQVRIHNADPDMPVYFGLDDVEIRAKKQPPFEFIQPVVEVLSEWPERIPLKHYRTGDDLVVVGNLDASPDTVSMVITPFTKRDDVVSGSVLSQDENGLWRSDTLCLERNSFPSGLYYGVITAMTDGAVVSETALTFMVTEGEYRGDHPRILYDNRTIHTIRERMTSDRFQSVREHFIHEAESHREKLDPSTFLFDIDQFPSKDWIPTLWKWFVGRMMLAREALNFNSIVYGLLGDRAAGLYCRDLMLVMARFPQWNHPWMENRGFHTYFPVGEFANAYATAYDVVYDLLSDEERSSIRTGLVDNFLEPAYRTYVEQNQITSNSSNWISHIAGGAIVALAAIYDDDREHSDMEPWLTGFILKEYKYINTVFGQDGSYGEGYRYYSFAMQSMGRTTSVLERLFGVDISGPVHNSYLETLWAGLVRSNTAFTFGDSESYLKKEAQAYWIGSENGPMNSWAWLLERTQDPHLSWLYHYLKDFDTFQEVLHETEGIPEKEPDNLGNVCFFKEVGTAVFKSGWSDDDFVFVFRSGPFYNHQHLDQGSFYLADHGHIFIEERYDGDHHYYDDPLYQSHAIQTISHNTLLIDRNPQSQKVGDPAGFAPGMNDQAVFSQWFDSDRFAGVTGELEGVYTKNVTSLRRHVLYIKPRAILLVDVLDPDDEAVVISSLFHTKRKQDITLHEGYSVFTQDGSNLFQFHLAPKNPEREIITDPHFLCQYDTLSLVKRGHLRVSATAEGRPRVMAHLLTATKDGNMPDVTITGGHDVVTGTAVIDGITTSFAVNTAGSRIDLDGFSSDSFILAHSDSEIAMVSGRCLVHKGQELITSEEAISTVYAI
ncbi:heparinase II/III family protein [Candidatus Latescibacterota bacterium]